MAFLQEVRDSLGPYSLVDIPETHSYRCEPDNNFQAGENNLLMNDNDQVDI